MSHAPETAILHRERPFLSLLVLLGAALAAVIAASLWPEGSNHAMREGGPVENATAVLYVLGVAAAWSARHPAFGKASAAAVSVLMITCVSRELSLRKEVLAAAGFDPSGASLSAWPNLIAAAIAVALVPSLLWLIWRYGRGALDALLRGKPFAVTLLVAFVCIVAAEGFDHFLKVSHGDAAGAASRPHAIAFALEETLEMMFPVLLFIAAYQTGVRWSLPWRHEAGRRGI